MSSIGSVWSKWDLHVHSPASFHWTGRKFSDCNQLEREQLSKQIFDRMNALDVCAFCIMDYWTFDGYLELKKYQAAHPGESFKRVFPGIELRMEAPTNYRLNTHVLLSDEVLPETLGHFLSHLKMGGPHGKPLSRQNFIDVAKAYDNGKLKKHGFKPEDRQDDDKMYELGVKTVEITRESLREAIELVGEDNCLLIQPYDTSDGLEDLDWKCHPYSDSMLMKWADCFETRDQVHVDLFLGLGHPTKAHVGEEFLQNLGGRPKPVVSGSDAHSVTAYGVFPSERITWLKAQPTFLGLKQVCHEPSLRCFIGKIPPKLEHVAKNPTKYMRSLSLVKVEGSVLEEHWFESIEISLNPGLIAIIGNKGSGKSALADILALAGNSHCKEMEFLTTSRFRGTGNKAKHFTATLTWADKSSVTVSLDNNTDFLQPERVRYLPQHFIENLCNEITTSGDTNFERELKKVIFSHVPDENRLLKPTLDELLDYLVVAHKRSISQLQARLKSTNEEIFGTEREMAEETIKSYQSALKLKETELEAHDKSRPVEVEEPKTDTADKSLQDTIELIKKKKIELNSIQQLLENSEKEKADLVAREALLARLVGHVDNFEDAVKTFFEDTGAEFSSAGLEATAIVSVSIDRTSINAAQTEVDKRLEQIQETIEGTEKTKGLETQREDCTKEINELQDKLEAPQKQYQNYLSELNDWQTRRAEIVGSAEKLDTVEYYKSKIVAVETLLPATLTQLKESRIEIVRQIHKELLDIRNVYKDLYHPVQKIATDSSLAKESIQLQFDAFLAPTRFDENFLEFIHRNRKGNFYGDDESRKTVQSLLEPYDFNSTTDVVGFLESLMTTLTEHSREGQPEQISIQSQMKPNKKITDLYDFIFGLSYLEPRYTLKLGGKDISQLSPGEKGALLLVFYLLLDKNEIPIIIDQPEQNLDNESVVKLLVDCIRQARFRRQVIIVTHNPNLAVVCDADQVICSSINKQDGHRIAYNTGAIEDQPINKTTVNVLEGTYPAFDNRRRKYHKPNE
jgi:ABC-type lipoprotein export system ATPase subunit